MYLFGARSLSVGEKEGLTVEDLALRFDVGVAIVVRWLKRLHPRTHCYRRRKLDMFLLARGVKQSPDAYQHERAKRFGVHQNAIFHGLKKLGISYKKTLHHPKTDAVTRHAFQ